MKLVAITLGCCLIALITSVALSNRFTPNQINPSALETNVITSTTPLPQIIAVPSSYTPPTTFTEDTERTIAFALPVTYIIGESHTYQNELTVTLQSISDSRCATEEICSTPQELVAEFTIAQSTSTDAVILGSAHRTIVVSELYEYTLVNTTETEATIIITPVSTPKVTASAITPKTTYTTTNDTAKAVTNPKAKPLTNSVSTKQTPTLTPSTETAQTEFKKALVAEITKQTNEFRKTQKRGVLSSDTKLAQNATRYSIDLLSKNYLSHVDTRGCDLSCRFGNNGYTAQAWGENLAMMSFEEQPSVEYVANFFMTQWQKSAGHRENLLSKAFTNQGIGVAFDQNNIYMVVQFALPG